MSSKIKSVWICSECGYESLKWNGQCPACGEWNTFSEEIKDTSKQTTMSYQKSGVYEKPILLNQIKNDDESRYKTGLNELDRVLGGGIVKGSVILLGGDPGIGKSTMLLQVCENLGESLKVLYVSGEESKRQLKLRAARLNVNSENLYIMTETDIESILEEIRQNSPDLVVIDSIQTMNHRELTSSTGSVTQVKECTNLLMRLAKELEIPIIIVGHVNKDGGIAGPKVLEHIVDAVLYFEGDKQMSYRILRGIKNRYGSTNEIGVFSMNRTGLVEVENPSLMFLAGRPKGVPGTCVACIMEGSRPIFAEVQGLAATSGFGNPRRMATGFDYNRMSLILAVLEKRAGYFFSNLDAYINVIGGIKLDEPASDLAVALALISSLKGNAIFDNAIAFGEIGLAGEIRAVAYAEERVLEAHRLGFERCVLPYYNLKSINLSSFESKINLIGVRTIKEAFDALAK
ncbi:dNA repair protein radA [Clostridium sp. CAG:557]|nr:dNA repair protein radA [Clostridium sp. CAG:557]